MEPAKSKNSRAQRLKRTALVQLPTEQLEVELEEVKADRARLLQILKEICTQLDLRKEELDQMNERDRKSY
jgi:hypothetical protein